MTTDARNPSDVEVYARVRVVLEFAVGRWSSDSRLDQVFHQGAEMALDKIRTAFPKEDPENFQIIGSPVVETILGKKVR